MRKNTLRWTTTTITAFIVLTLLSACASAQMKDPRAFMDAPLFGMIYDHDNLPVPNVVLTINGKSVAESDLTGRFVIPRLLKGDHSVTVTKPGYETLLVKLAFQNDTQVLYLQMYSQLQLVEMAEKKIDSRNWAQAKALLARAGRINQKDPTYQYVDAILEFRTGNPQKSIDRLNELLKAGVDDPSVLLFLADIYQYSLDRPADAVPYLKRYLEQKGNDAVSARLNAIESAKPKQTRATNGPK